MNHFDIKGKEFTNMGSTSRESILEELMVYWRRRGFPYYEKNDEDFERDLISLKNVKNSQMFNKNMLRSSSIGLRIANYFHPKIWHVKVKNAYSPIERFEDDKSFKKILSNSAKIWPERYSFRPGIIRDAIRIYSKTRAVTNFPPALAKAIIRRYSNNGDTVVDFSCGFGGRLLGCMVLDRKFIGIDPSNSQIGGCNELIQYCKKNFPSLTKSDVRLVQKEAEIELRNIESESVSLVFSSPPYFDHEIYEKSESQSYIKYSTYHDWKRNFLFEIVSESERILKRNGHLVVNLKNVNGYKMVEDFTKYAGAYFQKMSRLKMVIQRRPYRYVDANSNSYNYESILVFRKS